MEITAVIVADSVNSAGNRLTTFVLEYPRFIHSQLMTHRVFSRNTSSSRAIPVSTMIDIVKLYNVSPSFYGRNKKGMVAGEMLDDAAAAERIWNEARQGAIWSASRLAEIGLHKQHANRILEPFMPIICLLSGTEFDNFFRLRISHDAQPEIQELATKMREAMNVSTPKLRDPGQWHMPFVENYEPHITDTAHRIQAISAARCARISYRKQGDTGRDIDEELKFAWKLMSDRHLSPFEHVAMALGESVPASNFVGWVQFRSMIANINN